MLFDNCTFFQKLLAEVWLYCLKVYYRQLQLAFFKTGELDLTESDWRACDLSPTGDWISMSKRSGICRIICNSTLAHPPCDASTILHLRCIAMRWNNNKIKFNEMQFLDSRYIASLGTYICQKNGIMWEFFPLGRPSPSQMDVAPRCCINVDWVWNPYYVMDHREGCANDILQKILVTLSQGQLDFWLATVTKICFAVQRGVVPKL